MFGLTDGCQTYKTKLCLSSEVRVVCRSLAELVLPKPESLASVVAEAQAVMFQK